MAVMTTRPAVLSGRRGIAALMVLEAISLAVVSALHLSGLMHGHGSSSTGAGVPEAVIGAVLLAAAAGPGRPRPGGRPAALAATAFAIAGFIFGLTVTTRSGYLPDVIYHATVLPLLVVTLALIVRSKPAAPGPGGDSRHTRPEAANSWLRS